MVASLPYATEYQNSCTCILINGRLRQQSSEDVRQRVGGLLDRRSSNVRLSLAYAYIRGIVCCNDWYVAYSQTLGQVGSPMAFPECSPARREYSCKRKTNGVAGAVAVDAGCLSSGRGMIDGPGKNSRMLLQNDGRLQYCPIGFQS